MTRASYQAVVIGAGPNGLTAANLLADAGWQVLLLESQERIGGAVASDNSVHPDFTHDTFSSFYPLAAASPVLTAMELEKHGLIWSHAPSVVGSPAPGRGWALIHHDPGETASGLDKLHPGDGDAWLQMVHTWRQISGPFVDALLTPFPPLKATARLLPRLPRAGGLSLIKMLVEPARTLTQTRLKGSAAQLLIAGNAAHADIPPDAAGSGLFGWLLAMLAQDVGFPVAKGGAGHLARALADRFTAYGGDIRCRAEVDRVLTAHGRAIGVRLVGGETITASRAVIADVPASVLYGELVPWNKLPSTTRRRMRSFQWDPGTVKVDWALAAPVPWIDPPVKAPGTVHLAGSVDALSRSMTQIKAGLIPDDPFLLIGQMTAADLTRSPAGTEALWAYTHVPQHVNDDAGAGGITGRWDRDDLERFADRMQNKIEKAAPGFADTILARRILGPPQLQAADANLIGGALNGGTAALQPTADLPAHPRVRPHRNLIKDLYSGSASAHPGGGVHGACGANAARAAIAHHRLPHRSRPTAGTR